MGHPQCPAPPDRRGTLTQTHGCLRASWAVILLAGLMVSIWLIRFLASGVTVSHSGEGNCNRNRGRGGARAGSRGGVMVTQRAIGSNFGGVTLRFFHLLCTDNLSKYLNDFSKKKTRFSINVIPLHFTKTCGSTVQQSVQKESMQKNPYG